VFPSPKIIKNCINWQDTALYWACPRRRLHLTDPCHDAGDVYEGFERADSFLAAQGNASEALDTVEETLNQMPLLVEQPIDWPIFLSRGVSLDVCGCVQIIGDESAQMIGVIGRVHDDVLRGCEAFDQAACLWAVAPLAGSDDGADRQPEGVDRRVDLRGQATFGTTNTGSFKPSR